jgi:hypothetical protein
MTHISTRMATLVAVGAALFGGLIADAAAGAPESSAVRDGWSASLPSKAPGLPATSVEAPRDGWSSYAVKAPAHPAEGAAPVRRTVDPSAARDGWLSYAPRDARTELPAVSPSPFQWDAFGIGVGTALLSMLLLAGLVAAARQRRAAPRAA